MSFWKVTPDMTGVSHILEIVPPRTEFSNRPWQVPIQGDHGGRTWLEVERGRKAEAPWEFLENWGP